MQPQHMLTTHIYLKLTFNRVWLWYLFDKQYFFPLQIWNLIFKNLLPNRWVAINILFGSTVLQVSNHSHGSLWQWVKQDSVVCSKLLIHGQHHDLTIWRYSGNVGLSALHDSFSRRQIAQGVFEGLPCGREGGILTCKNYYHPLNFKK